MDGILPNAFFLAVGVGLFLEAIKYARRVRRGLRSRAWPSVQGKIEHSEPFAESMRAGRTRGTVYVPSIHYRYRVHGRNYSGKEITYGRESLYTSWPERAQRKCNQYPVGSRVSVFYDPARPDVACLERGTGSQLLGYVLALVFAGIALALVGVVVF